MEEIANGAQQQQQSVFHSLHDVSLECGMKETTREFANFLDGRDELKHIRSRFYFPLKKSLKNYDPSVDLNANGECLYFCGNSLGLQAKKTESLVQEVLKDWAQGGIEAHFNGVLPAASCDDFGRESMGRLVGASPESVVLMNGLTVNLHLLLISFYQPTKERFKIVIEKGAFPSDRYAVRSQAKMRGFPEESVIEIGPRKDEQTIRTEDIIELIQKEGDSIAVVCLSGVQYYTGQKFDMKAITEAGLAKGCYVGWDLAHAIGNVELKLDEWNVDFACWCTYKYLNSGPGCIAGAYVNKKHDHRDATNLMGWWGNRGETRFLMQDQCDKSLGVGSFKLCNPPPVLIGCVLPSLEIFDEVGMNALLKKQYLLTGYLEYLLEHLNREFSEPLAEIITPRDPRHRGCQLSLVFNLDLHDVHRELTRKGVFCDIRLPYVMRIAPAPLYNSFSDVYDLVSILRDIFTSFANGHVR